MNELTDEQLERLCLIKDDCDQMKEIVNIIISRNKYDNFHNDLTNRELLLEKFIELLISMNLIYKDISDMIENLNLEELYNCKVEHRNKYLMFNQCNKYYDV